MTHVSHATNHIDIILTEAAQIILAVRGEVDQLLPGEQLQLGLVSDLHREELFVINMHALSHDVPHLLGESSEVESEGCDCFSVVLESMGRLSDEDTLDCLLTGDMLQI